MERETNKRIKASAVIHGRSKKMCKIKTIKFYEPSLKSLTNPFVFWNRSGDRHCCILNDWLHLMPSMVVYFFCGKKQNLLFFRRCHETFAITINFSIIFSWHCATITGYKLFCWFLITSPGFIFKCDSLSKWFPSSNGNENNKVVKFYFARLITAHFLIAILAILPVLVCDCFSTSTLTVALNSSFWVDNNIRHSPWQV